VAACKNYNWTITSYLERCGGDFNDVGHYHLHIFPRYIGDGFGWTYGGETKNVNAEIAKRIKDRFK